MSSEAPDIYFEAFNLNLHPNGAVIDLALFSRKQGQPGPVTGTIRCSHESLREMAFILRRAIKDYEAKNGISIPVSNQRLNDIKVAPEDWQAFWR